VAYKVQLYGSFVLKATAQQVAETYLPVVVITLNKPAEIAEMQLRPDCPAEGIPDEEQALELALDYGRRAVDGKINGINVTNM